MNLEGKIDLIKQAVQAIKTAILGKNVTPSGNLSTYADAIDSIVTPNNQNKTVTTNGVVRCDEGYTGLGDVTVNVNQSVENKTITENGTYTAGSGYVGLGTVSVNVQPDLGTKTITANGTYLASGDNVDGYSSVTVNVPIPKLNYIVRNNVAENLEDNNNNILALSETTIQSLSVYEKYENDLTVSALYLSYLTTVSGNSAMDRAFQGCTGLTSVDLSSLITVSGTRAMYRAFKDCTNLTSVDLSNLTTVSRSTMESTFSGCTSLTNMDLSSLTTIGENAFEETFNDCINLTNVNLSSLTTINGEYIFDATFKGCTSLSSLSFPSLTSTSFGSYTNQFYNMLSGVTGCTVHFPSNLQSVIGNWSDVIGGFGGTNTVVLFDLPATT